MRTIINVAGLRRSGTTMLHLMLGSGPNGVSCGEIGDWFRLARYRSDSELPSDFAPLEDIPPSRFHSEALDYFDADYIVDSTKGLEWVVDVNKWAENQGIRVFNIVIWKNPVDQTYSYWKRGHGESVPWQYTWYHFRLFRLGVEFFTVSYDELVQKPSKKIHNICKRMGIPYFEGKEKFWRGERSFAGSSEGVRRQVDKGESEIRKNKPPKEFENVRKKVTKKLKSNRKLQEVIEMLKEKEISKVDLEKEDDHMYDPNALEKLEHNFWKFTKQPIYRFRWNVLKNYLNL